MPLIESLLQGTLGPYQCDAIGGYMSGLTLARSVTEARQYRNYARCCAIIVPALV